MYKNLAYFTILLLAFSSLCYLYYEYAVDKYFLLFCFFLVLFCLAYFINIIEKLKKENLGLRSKLDEKIAEYKTLNTLLKKQIEDEVLGDSIVSKEYDLPTNLQTKKSKNEKKKVFRISDVCDILSDLTNFYKTKITFHIVEDVSLHTYKDSLVKGFFYLLFYIEKNSQSQTISIDIDATKEYISISVKSTNQTDIKIESQNILEPSFSSENIKLNLYPANILLTQKLKGEIKVSDALFPDMIFDIKVSRV